jgi:hypothetical protein
MLRVQLPKRWGGDQTAQTNCGQGHGCGDETPESPTKAHLQSESHAVGTLSVGRGMNVAGRPI